MRATEPPRTGPVLVVTGGLPATGKSAVDRAAARRFGAGHLGIDTIRQSLYAFAERDADTDALRHAVTLGLGYTVAYALAEDLLTSPSLPDSSFAFPRPPAERSWSTRGPLAERRERLKPAKISRPALEDTPPHPSGA
ncbi:hypothetical protein ACIQY8_26645 [Streptomyces albidoflavus]